MAKLLDIPVVCAGDIFHKWDSPAELINFALQNLPRGMYAIPGQHDLPNHNYEDIKRSAYWTLVKAGRVHDLGSGHPMFISDRVTAWPYPWGAEVKPLVNKLDNGKINLAVIHAYCYVSGRSYQNPPPSAKVTAWWDKLRGYDAAVFGDNHIPFLTYAGQRNICHVFNHGGFFRRNVDERNASPALGILRYDPSTNRQCVTRHPYNVEEDKFIDVSETNEPDTDGGLSDFISNLDSLGEVFLDFKAAVNHWLDRNKTRVPPRVREAVLRLFEKRES